MRLAILPLLAAVLLCALAAPATAQEPTLSDERYEALDGVLTVFIRLDRRKPRPQDFDAVGAACKKLSTTDDLLRDQRRTCVDTVEMARRTTRFAACTSRTSCLDRAAALREAVAASITDARKANRSVDKLVANAKCRQELRTSAAEIRALQKFSTALRDFRAALRRGSEQGARRALERVAAADPGLDSAQLTRDDFRVACGGR